tara:strand:- start:7986 stop:8138 length:153 start_codon:yes stop_codon:yes gene_type:complete
LKELEESGFVARGDRDFVLVKLTHKMRANSKLKVIDKVSIITVLEYLNLE